MKFYDVVRASWQKIKLPFGYLLFGYVLFYSISHAHEGLFDIDGGWFAATLAVVFGMYVLQYIQVIIFLRAHEISPEWLFPALFNARRGVLNSFFPARSGTVLLLHTFKREYGIKWHSFVVFSLISAGCALWVSMFVALCLLFPWFICILMMVLSLFIYLYLEARFSMRYMVYVPKLIVLSFAVFATTLVMFFTILRGLGYELTVGDIAYFAAALNVLAQVSITPGNIGVREAIVGMMSPYFTLPISVGVVASSLVLVFRLGVYGAIWSLLEWYHHKTSSHID